MSLSAYSQVQMSQSSTQSVAGTVATILGTTSPIGGIIGTAIGVLQSIGITIKGKTQHISYDQAIGKAVDFSNSITPIFEKAYTKPELQGIVNCVPARFVRAQQGRWGLNGFNADLYGAMLKSPSRADAFSHQAGLFFLWVATNVDAESADEFRSVFDVYFADIFLGAISDAGLSANKLKGEVKVALPGVIVPGSDSGTGKPADDKPTASVAGSTNGIMLLGLLGAVVWYVTKGGKR